MKREKELKILGLLRQNARMSLTNLSKKTNVPISTIYEWLKAKQGGLIVRHTALLSYEDLGFMTRVSVAIKAQPGRLEELVEYLKRNPYVNNLYKVSPDFDLVFEGIFKDLADFDAFISRLEEKHGIAERKVFYIVRDMEREKFLGSPPP